MVRGRPRALTAAQQFADLRSCPICPGEGKLRLGVLAWTYSVAPTALSRTYTLRVAFRQGGTPEVFVDEPDLTGLAGDRRLPHVHGQRPTRLCLYLPGSGEWHAGLLISRTVVPWAAVWLLYFEEWLMSDEWKGGGMHPPAGGYRALTPKRGRQVLGAELGGGPVGKPS